MTDQVQTRKTYINGLYWVIAILTILVNGFWVLISLTEILSVAFTDAHKEYNWGADAYPWYYDTRQIYILYQTIWTLPFIAILIFQIYYIIKGEKRKGLYADLLFLLTFVTMYIIHAPTD